MSVKQENYYDVVIIGGGLSGLSSAYTLLNKNSGVTFVVIEAKDRVGGRTLGHELKCNGGSDYWDLGGQWVGSCQPHMMKLLQELDMDVFKQHITGKKVLQIDRKVSTYQSDIPSLPIHSLIDLHLFMRKLEKMRKTIPINDPNQCSNAKMWDSMTVEQAMNKWLWTKAAKETIKASGRCMFGAEPSDMSFLFFLTYMQAAGGVEPLTLATENMGQEFRVKGGSYKICNRLAAKIGEEKIHTSQAVDEIIQKDKAVMVQTKDGCCYNCERVIMAIPPHEAAKITYSPVLPVEKMYVLNRMPVGYLTKIVITYERAFWKEKGYSGEFVTNGGPSRNGNCKTGPLNIGYDATSYDGKKPALVTFIGGSQQIEYSELQPSERKQAVLQSLSDMLGEEALDCIDYAEKNWNAEPFNGGCPTSSATPGVISRIAPGLRYPWKRIHFAGTESATVWCGFLNGAIQAGQRAAHEVLYNIRPSSIEADDIVDTFYNMNRRRPRNDSQCLEAPSRHFRMYRVIIPSAVVIIAGVVFRKMLFALVINKPVA